MTEQVKSPARGIMADPPPQQKVYKAQLQDGSTIYSKNPDDERRVPRKLTGTERRKAILEQVESCICRDRQNNYGDAEDNFGDIAGIINIVLANKLRENLAPEDVATISAAIKLARIKTSPGHLDNWIDLAGYAACGGGIVQKRGEES